MSERVNSSNQSNDALLNDLSQICRSDYSLSLDGLQEIIERHGVGVAPNNLTITNYSFFHEACDNERVTEEIIRYLLECFPNAVRYIDEVGCTPLHWICENKNVTLGMVQLLIDAAPPESLRHENNNGYTPFHAFCTNKNIYYDEVGLEILKLLLKSYPESVKHADTDDKNLPLHIAAARQSPEFCSILIDAYPGSERMTNNNGLIPFHSACEHNTVAVVEYLYNLYPESINVVDPDGWYPIHHAIRYGDDDTEVVQFLLECNPDALSSTGQTPLHIACSLNDAKLRIFYHLIDRFPDFVRHENNNGFIPLHLLCGNNNLDYEDELDMLNWLLVKYPESVRHTVGGLLPIHLAAGRQSLEFCRVLIEDYPGSERICDDYGQLPFHRACRCNTSDTVKYLYELYPESINVADNDGDHPIYNAIWGLKNRSNLKDGIEMVRFLMDHNPDALSSTGQTALHIACGDNKVTPDIIQLLIDAFPDSVRHGDNFGQMPLFKLCYKKNLDDEVGLEILKLLLKSYPESVGHADTDNKNLPLHIAAAHQSPEFCSILIDAYPGSEHMTNNNGLIPFHAACQRNTVAVVEYLYNLYPESINVEDDGRCHPFYHAIIGLKDRSNHEDGIDVVTFLLNCNPDALSSTGQTALHIACGDKNVTLVIVQVLVATFPESVRHEDNKGRMPLHTLCLNENLDDELDILKLLLYSSPESVQHADINGCLPIHLACCWSGKSSEFCSMLIEEYPGSARIPDNRGRLPFHRACRSNSVAAAKYLYQLYPGCIKAVDNNGMFPIHYTILQDMNNRENNHNPEAAIEMVEFLVACDSNVVLQEGGGMLPLHWVCFMAIDQNTPIRLTYLKILQMLYDIHPEAIDCNDVISNIRSYCAEIQAFVESQLKYARQAKGRTGRQMRICDENGQVPLHRALYNNPTLGSVKLLVKRNPSTVRIQDNSDTLPLHVACQHCDCARVVEYLAGLDSDTLTVVDEEGNTALHHACRGAKHATILLLLEKFGGASISKRNTINQLPIHLLLESNEVSDREDTKYVESIYQLLRAYPETVIGVNEEWKLALSHSGKKRKL